MIPTGVTQFKDFQGKAITEEVKFDELIGICADERNGLFYGYARSTDGRFFCSHFAETGPGSFFVRSWYEVEEAAVLASAMEEGKNWSWVHKEISPSKNWEFMKKCIGWAIAAHRGQTCSEPIFNLVDGEVKQSYLTPMTWGNKPITVRVSFDKEPEFNDVYTLPELE